MDRASLVAQMVKNLPAIQETWVQSLGWEDALEKGMATYSSILPWRIPWTEDMNRGHQRNANQNHNEILSHTCQNGNHQKTSINKSISIQLSTAYSMRHGDTLNVIEVKSKSFSRIGIFTLWTIQSMEFSRPEYWSG